LEAIKFPADAMPLESAGVVNDIFTPCRQSGLRYPVP
jgi:hypothetical protein